MDHQALDLRDVRAVERYLTCHNGRRPTRIVFCTQARRALATTVVLSHVAAGGRLDEWEIRSYGTPLAGLRLEQAIVIVPTEVREFAWSFDEYRRWVDDLRRRFLPDKDEPWRITVID